MQIKHNQYKTRGIGKNKATYRAVPVFSEGQLKTSMILQTWLLNRGKHKWKNDKHPKNWETALWGKERLY